MSRKKAGHIVAAPLLWLHSLLNLDGLCLVHVYLTYVPKVKLFSTYHGYCSENSENSNQIKSNQVY